VGKCVRAREATGDNIKQRIRFACWVIKAKSVYSEYVILIAFPLQQWLHERASIYVFTYTALFISKFKLASN